MLNLRAGPVEVLSDGECVKLLRSHNLGRIGVVDREVRPLIFPINYFFDEESSSFALGRGRSWTSYRALMSASRLTAGMQTRASDGACWSRGSLTT